VYYLVEVRKLLFSSSLNTIKLLTIEDYVYVFRERGKKKKTLTDALLAGEAAPVCVERCGVHPDCNAFCNRLGYRGGQCLPPVYIQCCCNR